MSVSYNPYTAQLIYVGQYQNSPLVSIMNPEQNSIRSYAYTTTSMRSVELSQVANVERFGGAFFAGTCRSTSSAASIYIVASWLSIGTGGMFSMALSPVGSSLFLNSVDLVAGLAIDPIGPASLIVGGMETTDGLYVSPYMARVNTLYKSILFCVRYRHRITPNRRQLSGADVSQSFARALTVISRVILT